MKFRTLFFPFISLAFSSCATTYYCATMNTNDAETVKNEYGEFLIESDSLDVAYSFYGENAPITVAVINKSSRPIYVDWSQSGLIIENVSSVYLEPQQKDQTKHSNLVDFNYFLNHSDVMSYLKPHSSHSQQILELSGFNFQNIEDNLYENWYTEADSRGQNKIHNTIRYTEEDSPIYLRTFLTIYEDSMHVDDGYYYEIDFYVSELVKIKDSSPNSIAAIKLQRGDSFYVKEQKQKTESKENKKSGNILQKIESVTGKIEQWAVEGSRTPATDK